MTTLTTEQVVAAYSGAKASESADYEILSGPRDLRVAHLAMSRDGLPSLLIPLSHVANDATRLTRGVAISSAKQVEFVRRGVRTRSAAAVVECRDARLLRTFAGLVAAIVSRVEAAATPTWATVSALLAEWERLLGRRQLLTGESEMGLWGELWCIARSSRGAQLVEAWRGPDRERVDFLIDDLGVEVKVGRRPRSHMVSQSQVQEPLGSVPVVLISLYVMLEPLRGASLPDLVAEISNRGVDVAAFEERLASVGYSRDDEGAYSHRYVLLERPGVYRREDVPRVRVADSGVSDLRYRVELRADTAITGDALARITNTLGLTESFASEFPCA